MVLVAYSRWLRFSISGRVREGEEVVRVIGEYGKRGTHDMVGVETRWVWSSLASTTVM